MYDGTTFMGIENFTSCQFFEHDIAEDNKEYMVSTGYLTTDCRFWMHVT